MNTMRVLIFIILSAAFWVVLGSTFQWAAALVGVLMAGVLYWYLSRGPLSDVFASSRGGWPNPLTAVVRMVRYGWAVVWANLRVARLIIDYRRPVSPAILKVYAGGMGEFEQTIVANSITLTPGTIAVDFSADGQYLYVHVLEGADVATARRELLNHLETHFGRGLNWWILP